MATMKDIAKKTGVSITTVSRVLNYDKSLSVSDDIRRTILDTAEKMNYKTPRNRSKKTPKKKLVIGIVLWYDMNEEQNDPYYWDLRRGVEVGASQAGVETKLVYKESNRFPLKQLGSIDGLICIGKFTDEQIKSFEKVSKFLVFVDSSPREEEHDSIVIDFNKAVRDVLHEILQAGYSSIGYIGGVEQISKQLKLGERRELVFRDYLYQRNKLQTKFIHVGDFSVESGYNLMKEALSKRERAEIYFCANDSIAFGAMRAIHEKGLTIPDDIAIVGFNDNNNSAYTYPPLSTVSVPTMFMGELALQTILERLEGRRVPLKKIVPVKIVKRQSF